MQQLKASVILYLESYVGQQKDDIPFPIPITPLSIESTNKAQTSIDSDNTEVINEMVINSHADNTIVSESEAGKNESDNGTSACTHQGGMSDICDRIKALPYYDNQITYIKKIEKKDIQFYSNQTLLKDLNLPQSLVQAYSSLGRDIVSGLYSHQGIAILSLLQGKHACVATSTSSGK